MDNRHFSGKEKARRELAISRLKNAAPVAIVPFKDGFAVVTAQSPFRKVRIVDEKVLFAARGEYESVNVLHGWLVEDISRIRKMFSGHDVFLESVVDNPNGAVAYMANSFPADPVVAEFTLLFADQGKFYGLVINPFGERKYLDGGSGAVIGGSSEMGVLLANKLRQNMPPTEKEAIALAAEVLRLKSDRHELEIGVLSGFGVMLMKGGK
ncbi:MAG: hypothetical protein AAB378_03285 [Patescibacteria group bacterium]